jgi:hypothetical protein
MGRQYAAAVWRPLLATGVALGPLHRHVELSGHGSKMDVMDNGSTARTVGGIAVVGAIITGIAGLFVTASSTSAGHWEGAGLALIAAAIAFVGVANVIFRQ